MRTLPPAADVDAQADAEHWLMRWGLTLGDLTRELLSDVERRLALGDKGQPLAAATAGRYRSPPAGRGMRAIDVVEAEIDWDEPGEPKTGDRVVPIPPELVELLRSWVDEHELAAALLFRTRSDRQPTPSNWGRALKRACRATGREPMRVYDCRHACATTWLRAGVPLGEVALRLGHSVETLVLTYVGALDGDDVVAKRMIDAALAGAQSSQLSED